MTKEENYKMNCLLKESEQLDKKIEEWEGKKEHEKKLIKVMLIETIVISFLISLGLTLCTSIDSLTISNFLAHFTEFSNLFPPLCGFLFGGYYSLATYTTDYQVINRILNIANLQSYFLKKEIEEEQTRLVSLKETNDLQEERENENTSNVETKKYLEQLKNHLKNLEKHGEKIPGYLRKCKWGRFGLKESCNLARDGIDEERFKGYLEEQINTRKLKKRKFMFEKK